MVKIIKLFFLIKTSKKYSKLNLSSGEELAVSLDEEISLSTINTIPENEGSSYCFFYILEISIGLEVSIVFKTSYFTTDCIFFQYVTKWCVPSVI